MRWLIDFIGLTTKKRKGEVAEALTEEISVIAYPSQLGLAFVYSRTAALKTTPKHC